MKRTPTRTTLGIVLAALALLLVVPVERQPRWIRPFSNDLHYGAYAVRQDLTIWAHDGYHSRAGQLAAYRDLSRGDLRLRYYIRQTRGTLESLASDYPVEIRKVEGQWQQWPHRVEPVYWISGAKVQRTQAYNRVMLARLETKHGFDCERALPITGGRRSTDPADLASRRARYQIGCPLDRPLHNHLPRSQTRRL